MGKVMSAMMGKTGDEKAREAPVRAPPAPPPPPAAEKRPARDPMLAAPRAEISQRMAPPPFASLMGSLLPQAGPAAIGGGAPVEAVRAVGLGSGLDGVAELRPGTERELPFPPPAAAPAEQASGEQADQTLVIDGPFSLPEEEENEEGVRRITIPDEGKRKSGRRKVRA